jgi:hypothetical protein
LGAGFTPSLEIEALLEEASGDVLFPRDPAILPDRHETTSPRIGFGGTAWKLPPLNSAVVAEKAPVLLLPIRTRGAV